MLTSNKTISHKDLQGKCFCCGNATHKAKECPRKNLNCHIAPVCLSKGNQKQHIQQHQRRSSKKGSASAPASQSAFPNPMCDATAAQICSIPSCNIPTLCSHVTVKPVAKGTPFSHAALQEPYHSSQPYHISSYKQMETAIHSTEEEGLEMVVSPKHQGCEVDRLLS